MSHHCIKIGISIILGVGAITGIEHPSNAEIIQDSTLPNNTNVTVAIGKENDTTFFIDGGTAIGSNLFHSFSKFSLLKSQNAYFNSTENIQNIFSRVTGGEVSKIDGLITARSRVNLFLINPNGIIFGTNAQLNIQGSFVASTADSVRFAEGGEFITKPSSVTPLLNVTTPIGLQYGANSGSIQLQGESIYQPSTLQVQGSQTLALIGGNVILGNANLSTIKSEGRIEIGGVSSAALVGIESVSSGFLFKFDKTSELGDIRLYSGTNINSLGDLNLTGKNIVIQDASLNVFNNLTVNAQERVELTGRSAIDTGVPYNSPGNHVINTRNLLLNNQSFISINNGNLEVNASDSVQLTSDIKGVPSRIYATASDGDVSSGNLTINTGYLLVDNGSQIITNSSTAFSGIIPRNVQTKASLTINASDSVTLRGNSFDEIYPSGVFTQTDGDGKTGDLTINTRVLRIEDGAQVIARNLSVGKSGNLTVNATDKVGIIGTSPKGTIPGNWPNDSELDEQVPRTAGPLKELLITGVLRRDSLPSGIFTDSVSSGDAGMITINTGELTAQNGGRISADTFSAGQGGDLMINATDKVELIGTAVNGVASGLFTRSGSSATGNAGSLTIVTGNLLVKDGAQVSVSTFGTAQGGNLFVQAAEGIKLIGVSRRNIASGLFAQANRYATGDAGSLKIDTSTLVVRDGAQVSASTFGAGKGGDLFVQASDIKLIGTAADASFSSGLFTVATANSTGSAGKLTVNADLLDVQQGGGIAVQSSGKGSAGNLNINARRIRLDDQAFISADTRDNGSDPKRSQANINLRSHNLILSRGSNITTNATGNNVIGGNIDIDTNTLVAIQNSDISANSADFRGGRININAQNIFGTKFRNQRTPNSDITATGANPELSGAVEITTPDVDPSQSLSQLPSEAVDVSNQISQQCRIDEATAQRQNQFIITGRGGIPINPYEIFDNSAVITDWVTINDVNSVAHKETDFAKEENTTADTIVEAQGWVYDAQGNLVLTAEATKITHHSLGLTTDFCRINKG
ncbi:S-layer family protein [Anabaena cylindrica FACHB-170]|uniref:S-layer family protein n=1 Tax=Anabaena cylindrica FACHB-318 TaxID=2692880 RepID=A0ABR7ZQG9_ANACY|nr:S-layer family protein [Anabaena cylindrica]MBD2174787.1 S-layer family protein [Anabaena cylindrica FACHB-318]MBD2286789.1 S-layer family protein [Anabaena cylindrica FACHB-170]